VESSGRVGGTWVYTPGVDRDNHGLPRHSSMYQNLTTNLPKEVMAFPDFPFPRQEKSFLHHTEVLDYLELYTDTHNLRRLIQFTTQVERVAPSKGGWEVTTRHLPTGETSTASYGAVMVCTGHYSVPVTPAIPGLEQHGGRVLHSHHYRTPQQFAGVKVLVLGGGASGTDIAVEVAGQAETVYLAHNNPPLTARLPDNVVQVAGVAECPKPGVLLLRDGSRVECGGVILATGYHYTFPFLAPECGVEVQDRVVGPLYKHLISTRHPTLAFVGLPVQICPFPQFDLQVRFFVRSLVGEVELPSREAMDKDTQEEARYRREVLGLPDRYFHKMGTLQWEYNRSLATLGGLEHLPRATEELYMQVNRGHTIQL